MSIRNHIRKLKPIQETYTAPVDKVQNVLTEAQLKNRYNDPTVNKRFVLGIDRSKMKLYDVDKQEQDLVDDGQDDTPVFDKTSFGKRNLDFSKLKV